MIFVLALEVTDPGGIVVLDEELELPADRVLRAPDGRHLLGIYGARFDEGRGLVELVAGRERDGRPVRGVRRSDELDPYTPFTATLERRGERWTVEATLGLRYAPPPPVPAGPSATCGAIAGQRVTARELRAELPDGTGWIVAAGVPVEPRPDGTLAVATGGLAFAVRAEQAELGVGIGPAATFPVGDAPLVVAPGVVGATGLGEVRLDGPAPLPVAGVSGARDPLVTLRVPCAEVRLRADPRSLAPRRP